MRALTRRTAENRVCISVLRVDAWFEISDRERFMKSRDRC
jgi:hypothetical protein